jgi:molybdate transport system substrate-binding protein
MFLLAHSHSKLEKRLDILLSNSPLKFFLGVYFLLPLLSVGQTSIPTTTLAVHGGGAISGLVKGVQDNFEKENQVKIEGTFSAVGTIRDQLVKEGAPCDVVVLSKVLMDDLANDGLVMKESLKSVGVVATGLAVPATRQNALPSILTPEELKAAFRAAPVLYFSNMEKSSAGIHFKKVMKELGIDDELKERYRNYPSSSIALVEMAKDANTQALAGSQLTEINSASGVRLVGLLPKEFALDTEYVAGICIKSKNRNLAMSFEDLLTGQNSLPLRKKIGFINP